MSKEQEAKLKKLISEVPEDDPLLGLVEVLNNLAIEDIFLSRKGLRLLIKESGIGEEVGTALEEVFGRDNVGNSSK